MPKATFFNLPLEKQQTLLSAAKKEFSRVTLNEASISNIIKSAGIPRGSFYQYFEDKEDAFFFLLNEFTKEKKNDFIQILTNTNGDLFATNTKFFELMVKEVVEINFLKNALLNMTYQIETAFERMISDQEINENFDKLCNIIDKSNLNIDNEQELFHIIQIITAITFRNLIQTFARNLPYEEAMRQYTIEINLLKKGLSKT